MKQQEEVGNRAHCRAAAKCPGEREGDVSRGVSTGRTFSAAISGPHCCARAPPSTRQPDTVPGLRSTAVT